MGFWGKLFGSSKDNPLAANTPNAAAGGQAKATNPAEALTAQQWFGRASAARDDDEKVSLYSEAIRLKSDYPEAYFHRGGARP